MNKLFYAAVCALSLAAPLAYAAVPSHAEVSAYPASAVLGAVRPESPSPMLIGAMLVVIGVATGRRSEQG